MYENGFFWIVYEKPTKKYAFYAERIDKKNPWKSDFLTLFLCTHFSTQRKCIFFFFFVIPSNNPRSWCTSRWRANTIRVGMRWKNVNQWPLPMFRLNDSKPDKKRQKDGESLPHTHQTKRSVNRWNADFSKWFSTTVFYATYFPSARLICRRPSAAQPQRRGGFVAWKQASL